MPDLIIEEQLFDGQDFSKGNLKIAKFDNCSLKDSNFSDFDLSDFVFSECIFENCKIGKTNIEECTIEC